MKKIETATENFTKRDLLNSRSGNPLQDFTGTLQNIIKAAILEDTDEDTGEIKNVGVMIDEEYVYYTTISSTVIDSLDELIDIINEEGKVNVRIDKRKSKGGRDFLTMTVL